MTSHIRKKSYVLCACLNSTEWIRKTLPLEFTIFLSWMSFCRFLSREQLKHTNNVSTISVNNTDPSNHLINHMNQSASSSMKVLQIEDGASNRNPSSSSLSSQNDNLSHLNGNLLYPKSPAAIEQGQQPPQDSLLPHVQPSSGFSQSSPTQSPIKPGHSFFRASLIKFFEISVLIRTMYKGYCVALFEFKFLPLWCKRPKRTRS